MEEYRLEAGITTPLEELPLSFVATFILTTCGEHMPLHLQSSDKESRKEELVHRVANQIPDEYVSTITRDILSPDPKRRRLCKDLYADPEEPEVTP